MLSMKRRIRNMILQIPIFFTIFTSVTPSSLEVLYESNSATNPSWSYTLFPSTLPLPWRAAAELCESIPGAVMAKVRNEETVKVILRFLQLSHHNSPVWTRNRQTITEVLTRERSDVPSPSGYSESNQTFAYPDEGKAGLTLRCSLIRPEVGISHELCNNLSAFGAICIQPSKSSRPYSDVCPVLQNRPWVFLRRYKKKPAEETKTYLTSFSTCKGNGMPFIESKCHPKKGWQDNPSCPEKDQTEANVIYKQQPKRWKLLSLAKIKYGSPLTRGSRSRIPLRPTSLYNERFKRSDHPDSIEHIERIMRNITDELKGKQERDNKTTNAENPKNVSFSMNVRSNSSGLGSNAINSEKALPYHLQLNRDDGLTIDLEENEIPKFEKKVPNRNDKINLLAEEIVKYLNYSSEEDQAYTSSDEYLSSTPSSSHNNISTTQANVNLRRKYGINVNKSTAINPRHKRVNDQKPENPRVTSSLRNEALSRSSSESSTILLRNADNATTGIHFNLSEELQLDKLNKHNKDSQRIPVANITRKISKDNLFLSKLVDTSESIDITNATSLREKEKMQNQTSTSPIPSMTNVNVTNNDTFQDKDKLRNQTQNSTSIKEIDGFKVVNNPVMPQNDTQNTKITLIATVGPMTNSTSSNVQQAHVTKGGSTKKTFIDFILGKLLQ